MIVRLRRDRISVERGFDRRGARTRAGARPLSRSGLFAVMHDREYLSEPYVFAWVDEGPGRERAGGAEPVLDVEDAMRCPLEVVLDYPAFVRAAFADYDVAFYNADVEAAGDAWAARLRWRALVRGALVETDWTVPRGQEWRDAFERPARPPELVRALNHIRRTSGSERRHERESISLSWAAVDPPERVPSVPIDDLFDYDRFCTRYLQMTKRFFVYDPVETAASEHAAASAWRRYVHSLLTADDDGDA
jgi:hypothetical protein